MTDIANTEQYEAWNGDNGRRWTADPDRRDRVLAEVGDVLFDAAKLTTGECVLDIGCGCGAVTLVAAQLVGADGAAVGLDLSAPMLDVARRRAADRSASNVTFLQGDAQTFAFDDAFDVAISRFGTMFFADPTAAFTNIGGALRAGGRLCIATWQPQAANDWLAIPLAALVSAGAPAQAVEESAGYPMFAQSDQAEIASTLTAARFDAMETAAVTVALHLGASPADAAAHVAETGPVRAVLETVPQEQRGQALAAVEAVMADYGAAGGVQLAGAILLTTATRR